MKKIIAILFVCISLIGYAQIPNGYYDTAEGLTGEELKAALHNIIDNHTTYPYTDSGTDVWDILKESDRDPNNPDNVILIYTGWSVNAAQEYNNGAGWSREHVWAKSHGDFGETPPPGTDAHHLRPCDISVNSARGNKDFDNGGTQHSEATECYTDADSWEPRPAVKGDVARMMFYMATRYEGDVTGEPDLELVDYTGTDGPIFGKLSTLIQWNTEDPVDDFERNRNEVVYSYQQNRNPFVDHPEYVNAIYSTQNSAPEITNIVIDPANPESTENVTISATITDSDGTINTASIKWGTSTGSYSNTISMSNSGNTYSGEVAAQADETSVYFVVEAEDNDSEITTSIEYNYTVGDQTNQAPIVSNVELNPAIPTENDNVLVSCSVNDADGSVVSVFLKWKKGTGDFTNVSMNLSGGKYYGQIPKQSVGETIFYSIVAEDNEGLQGTYDNSYEISESNGIEDYLTQDFKIYPNPVSGILYLNVPDNYSVEIYSIIGEKMLIAKGKQIDVHHLETGIYFVLIKNDVGENIKSIKLIKK